MRMRDVRRFGLAPFALAIALVTAACARPEYRAAHFQYSPESASIVRSSTSTVRSSTGTGPSSAGTVSESSALSPVHTYHLAGEAHDVQFSGGVMWVPEFTGTEAVLNRFSATGNLISHITLGKSSSSGINSRLRVAVDGSIWVSDDYTLYQVNPDTGAVVSTSLAVEDPNAAPDALSENSALPGTWISAFTFDATGNVVVARNNVPVVEVLTSAGRVSRAVPLGGHITSVSDMNLRTDGVHLLIGRPAELSQAISPVVEPVDVMAAVAAPPVPLRSDLLGLTNVFLPNGDCIRTSSFGDATLTRADGTSAVITLASKDVEISDPAGKLRTVTVRERLIGAGLGSDDTEWALIAALGGGTDLVRLQ